MSKPANDYSVILVSKFDVKSTGIDNLFNLLDTRYFKRTSTLKVLHFVAKKIFLKR